MAYFDNPLIPILQQAPSAMYRVGIADPLNPLSDAPLYSYWNAQQPSSLFTDVNGTTEVTTDGNDVKNWRELTNTQPPATEATNFPSYDLTAGISSVQFDGTNDILTALATTDQFKFMHDGSGGEIMVVAKATTESSFDTMVSNNSDSTADVGFSMLLQGTGGSRRYESFIGDGGGGLVQNAEQTAGDYVNNIIYVHETSFKSSATPKATLELNNVDVFDQDGSNSNTPSNADAETDLTIGGTTSFPGNIYSIAIFNEILDAETRTGVAAYLATQAGTSIATNDKHFQVFSPDTGYDDFVVDLNEIFFFHPNLPYCTTHSVYVKTLVGTDVEVTIVFFAGDVVFREETLTDTGADFSVPGVTKIGFKTTGTDTATVRSWSR